MAERDMITMKQKELKQLHVIHKVLFHEASTAFGDLLAITFNDPDHSIGEHCFLTFGYVFAKVVLVLTRVNRYTLPWDLRKILQADQL